MESVTVPPGCPVCGNRACTPFFPLDGVPAVANRLYTSRADALAAPRGQIELAHCDDCQHVFNRAFTAVDYGVGYENALHFSASFRDYAEAAARDLVARFGLHNRTIVEIGCGDGYFLRRLCEIGNNRGIGFDPSLATAGGGDGVELRAEPFVLGAVDPPPDFIVCRQVLEHQESPSELIDLVRRTLDGRPGTGYFFEVPNAERMLESGSGWDLVHEHVSYFTHRSLRWLFREAGLAGEMSEAFDGQYLCMNGPGTEAAWREVGGDAAALPSFDGFAAAFASKTEVWRAKLASWSAAGERTAVWGIGSKGTMLLVTLRAGSEIAAVDVNPRKRGLYVPCSGHRVVAPEELRDAPPRRVIVTNPLYASEVGERLEELEITASVEVAA